jgi:hypothetical protein
MPNRAAANPTASSRILVKVKITNSFITEGGSMTTLAWFQDPWWAERASLRPHMAQHRAATSQIHERTRRMSGCCNNPTDRSAIQLRVICGQENSGRIEGE